LPAKAEIRGTLGANLGAAVAAVFFGASVVAVRVAVRDVPPVSLAVLRFGIGGVLLLLAAVWLRPQALRLERSVVPRLALLALVFYALFPLSFNVGLRFTEASRGALMLATMPVWSAVLARKAVGERLLPQQVAGVVLSVTGIAVAFAERGLLETTTGGAILGDGLLLLTAFWGALYGVLSKRALASYSALTVTTYPMLLGTAYLLPVAWVEGLPSAVAALDGTTLWLVLFVAVLGGSVAFYLWTAALSRLTPTQVAVYVNINPLVAASLAALLLHERLTPLFAVGFAAVVAGVLLVNRPRPARSGSPSVPDL
jgi:drug/metabolite transporter (DMT)-like permease